MDKIQKILNALSAKEHEAMILLMHQIKSDFRKIPGLKPLKGMKGWYRVRLGQYRIIFVIDSKTKEVEFKRISRRNENTYRHLS